MSRYSEVEWEKAACKDTPTQFFFVFEENKNAQKWLDIGILRRICASCPIFTECLAYALGHENYGVWGGMLASERNTLNGRAPAINSMKVIYKLGQFGVRISEIEEAIREYKNHERSLEN